MIPELDPLWALVARAALAMPRKDWEQGVLAQAFLDAGDLLTVIQLCRAALIYATADGRLSVLGDSGLIDCAMLGESLIQAAAHTSDAGLIEADGQLRQYILFGAARSENGALYHAGRQLWVDSFNCAVPYLAAMGYFDEALAQISALHARLWNPESRLYSHIWDEERMTFASSNFWGVGNGWAAFGLSRVVAALPPDRVADRDRLIGHVTELIDGLLPYLRDDGLFHNVVDRSDTFVETNLSQVLACVLYRGIAAGWLDSALKPVADRMRRAARAMVDTDGFVQGVCGAPAFDRPGIAPEGQAFFLLMESAAVQMGAAGGPV